MAKIVKNGKKKAPKEHIMLMKPHGADHGMPMKMGKRKGRRTC